FSFFFIHEHFTRFLTTEHHRSAPWWYFVPIAVVGILPWLPVVLSTVVGTWRESHQARGTFSWQRFALVWSASIFVFFSVSGSKLPSYILPIFPALALTVAWQLARLPCRKLAALTLPLVVGTLVLVGITLFAYAPIVERVADARQPLAPLLAYRPWIQLAAIVALTGNIAGDL